MCRKASLRLLNGLLQERKCRECIVMIQQPCRFAGPCLEHQKNVKPSIKALQSSLASLVGFLATFPLRAEPCFRKKKKRSRATSSQENCWNAHRVKKQCMNRVCLLRCPLESVALVSGRPEAAVKEALAAPPGTMPYS